ncbi:DUF1501 domain-containing protein [Vibrio sp. WXL210]|uniref:DUF1501 domain-containing protein n=1 Tax=Vibrio sp. WXL210 TaxID=3450709 RepID=UPI003EC5B584
MASGSLPLSLTLPSTALAQGKKDYKALIAVYLAGGNDSFNMVLPIDNAQYNLYRQSRPNGVEKHAILSTGLRTDNGVELGLHPNMPQLNQLLNSHKGTIITNVGPLIEPLGNRNQPRPSSLGSHASATNMWQTRWNPASQAYTGSWLGAMMDFLHQPDQSLPESINVSGFSISGQESNQLKLNAGTMPGLSALENSPAFARHLKAYSSLTGQDPLESEWLARLRFLDQTQAQISAQLSRYPVDESISGGKLAPALQTVKQMMQAAKGLGHSRQVFTVVMGGWDTHKGSNDERLAQLDAALASFYLSLERDGFTDDSLVFTMSDFGRSINENANQGTDHGWGSNQIVLGKAVDASKAHGDYPEFKVDGVNALGNKIKPTLSSEQMAATLCRWFGLSETAIDYIFPSLNADNPNPFASRYLSFIPLKRQALSS